MKQFFSCLSSRSNYKGLNLFFTFLAFFLFSSLFVFPLQRGHCNQVTLTWDPNTEPDLAGYEIYYGTSSGNYQWNIDIGNVTTYTLYGLNVGVTYYIAATAYNTQGLQSGYSNEVVYTVSSCTYTISPSSASFSSLGGSGSVLVTTQAGCNWGTSASIPWITVTSGSGMGSGTMSYYSLSQYWCNPYGQLYYSREYLYGNRSRPVCLCHHRLRRRGRIHFPFGAGFNPGGGRTDLHYHPQYRLPDC